MKTIPPKYIEPNEAGEDIFSYFRKYFNEENLSEAGIISIKASSTLEAGDSNRSDVSTLIRGDDGKRWVSDKEENASFTINFHSNFVALSSYVIYTSAGLRHIKCWDLFGINHNRKYLIDRRSNESICEENQRNQCSQDSNTTFSCQYPGFFNKFAFVLTCNDSNNDPLLSMTYLQFFGIVTSNRFIQTHHFRCNHANLLSITLILLLS